MAAGTQDHPLRGGGSHLIPQAGFGSGFPPKLPQKDMYGAVSVRIFMYGIKYQIPGPGGYFSASKGPVNPYQAHRVPAATVTTTVAVAYTANIVVTRQPGWSLWSRATTRIHQATPSFPRPQAGGESPRVFPRAHHVHIHDASPEW